MSKQSVLVFAVLVLGACGGTPRPVTVDSGTGGTDSGVVTADTGTGPRDTGTTPRDTGPVSTDPCASDAAGSLAGAGCNGGFMSAAPAANGPAGACTGSDVAEGSCTGAAVCSAAAGESGFCFPTCTAGATYVSTGGCPTGFRCFDLDNDICFRDCNDTHACPTGMMCDEEGSCVPM